MDKAKSSKLKSLNLIKNTGILAIGTFSSKVLVFFLVPVYTAFLTVAEYGTYDIVISTITLLIPILTLNIADGVLRFSMEDDLDIVQVVRIGFSLVCTGSVIVSIVLLIPNMPWSHIEGIYFVAPIFFLTAMNQLLTYLARGLERMKAVAVAGITSSISLVGFNIIFLVVMHLGIFGFYFATTISYGASVVYLTITMRKIIFSRLRSRKKTLTSKMIRYSFPLAATAIGWWFVGASDRYIVLIICGAEANGLYSVAYQIPTILTTVAGIFLQAWQVSAVKEFNSEDSDYFLSNVFSTVEMLVVLVCSMLILFSPLISMFLYSGDFFEAWRYVPFLLVYSVFSIMSAMWAPFFSSSYDSKPIAVSTVLGGLVNILFGIPLVACFGVYGAVFSSILAGITNWAYRGIKSRKYIVNHFHMGKSLLVYAVLFVQALIMVLEMPIALTLSLQCLIIGVLVLAFRKNLKFGFTFVKELIKTRK